MIDLESGVIQSQTCCCDDVIRSRHFLNKDFHGLIYFGSIPETTILIMAEGRELILAEK